MPQELILGASNIVDILFRQFEDIISKDKDH